MAVDKGQVIARVNTSFDRQWRKVTGVTFPRVKHRATDVEHRVSAMEYAPVPSTFTTTYVTLSPVPVLFARVLAVF